MASRDGTEDTNASLGGGSAQRVQIPQELTVGQLAARGGVNVSALHFFERQGLLTSHRTAGNQRRYRRDALRRVALIRIAQRVGIPLKEVAEVLAVLPQQRTPTRQDWARLSQHWQARLDQRIRHLQQLRDDFTDCIGCGCLSIDRCILVNPYDELGAEGPGPRRLLQPPPSTQQAREACCQDGNETDSTLASRCGEGLPDRLSDPRTSR